MRGVATGSCVLTLLPGLALAGLAACCAAAAQELPGELVALADGGVAAGGPRLEAQLVEPPAAALAARSDAAPLRRLDLALIPAFHAQRRSAWGLAASVHLPGAGPRLRPGAVLADAAADVGVLWRHTFDGQQRVDVTAWRRMTPPPDAITLIHAREPQFGARVEMQFVPARSAAGFVAEMRALGLQLDNGARIGVRRRDGRPVLYYRQQF